MLRRLDVPLVSRFTMTKTWTERGHGWTYIIGAIWGWWIRIRINILSKAFTDLLEVLKGVWPKQTTNRIIIKHTQTKKQKHTHTHTKILSECRWPNSLVVPSHMLRWLRCSKSHRLRQQPLVRDGTQFIFWNPPSPMASVCQYSNRMKHRLSIQYIYTLRLAKHKKLKYIYIYRVFLDMLGSYPLAEVVQSWKTQHCQAG